MAAKVNPRKPYGNRPSNMASRNAPTDMAAHMRAQGSTMLFGLGTRTASERCDMGPANTSKDDFAQQGAEEGPDLPVHIAFFVLFTNKNDKLMKIETMAPSAR
jgi:hypothetical protein